MARSRVGTNAFTTIVALVGMVVVLAMAGTTACYIVGGVFVLGGIGGMGDRRANPMTGFGALVFGLILLVVGSALPTEKATAISHQADSESAINKPAAAVERQ